MAALTLGFMLLAPAAWAQPKQFFKAGIQVFKPQSVVRAKMLPSMSVQKAGRVLPKTALGAQNITVVPPLIKAAAVKLPAAPAPELVNKILFQARVAQLAALPPVTPFPNKTQIDGVIFDMDGTLLDSLPAWENAAAKLLQERGFEMTPEMEEYIKYISLTEGATYLKEQFNLPETPQELVSLVLAHVREQYLTQIPAKPGVKELLQWLHAQGIKISVATASDKELAARAFERLGLAQYIDFIITCDEVGVGKLSADIYEIARARMGTDKPRTLVVEDALYALKTAKNAGFLTVGVAEPTHSVSEEAELERTADYFFTSLEESIK